MDSDDDMHDANDVESPDDLYSEDTVDSDDAVDGEYEYFGNDSDDSDYFTLRHQQQSYVVLSEADIRQRQEDDITNISTVLSISRVEAGILLVHYNWSVSKVHEEWFADEERFREAVGLLNNPVVDISNAREVTCGICFDTFPKDDIYAAACGHPFCSLCWAGYISTSINGGPECLMLRCSVPCCGAAVGQDMINALVSEDDRKKQARFSF